MIKAFVAMAGLLIGAFLGGALLMLNPIALIQGAPAGLAGPIRTYDWEAGGEFRGLSLTPLGLLGDRGDKDDAIALHDPGIEYARAEIVMLTGKSGSPPALGVKISATARANSLLQARLGTTTAWNIAWPDRGTLLLAGSENYWEPLRHGLWSAVRGRGFRLQQASYRLPPVAGLGLPVIVGGSGEFVGVSGAFREEFSSADAAPGEFTGRRQLALAIE